VDLEGGLLVHTAQEEHPVRDGYELSLPRGAGIARQKRESHAPGRGTYMSGH
jgi:hypothetical protein